MVTNLWNMFERKTCALSLYTWCHGEHVHSDSDASFISEKKKNIIIAYGNELIKLYAWKGTRWTEYIATIKEKRCSFSRWMCAPGK